MNADAVITSLVTGEMLLEMPQYYPGSGMTYQKDSKFTRISIGNFRRYRVIHQDTAYTYVLGPTGSFGFVFSNADIENPSAAGLLPILSLELRDCGIKGYKQAYHLRIRQDFASRNVATIWYCKYVDLMGGIVSDFEHLEGGKVLWRSFINAVGRGYKMSAYNVDTGKSTPVGPNTPDDEIWSFGPDKKRVVLVMER